MSLYVQYGCGLSAPASWKNFDVSPTLRLQKLPVVGQFIEKSEAFPTFPNNVRYGDIVKGLPVEKGSCSGIYCSHVLEHLSLADCRTALRNTHVYLKERGTFRLVLPDLEHLARQYVESPSSDAAYRFMRKSYLGLEERPRTLMDFARMAIGNSRHLWMWDYKSLASELQQAGFSEVRRASFGDSNDSRFSDVEERGRWENCLGLECKK